VFSIEQTGDGIRGVTQRGNPGWENERPPSGDGGLLPH
jgi:hypothetical protein